MSVLYHNSVLERKGVCGFEPRNTQNTRKEREMRVGGAGAARWAANGKSLESQADAPASAHPLPHMVLRSLRQLQTSIGPLVPIWSGARLTQPSFVIAMGFSQRRPNVGEVTNVSIWNVMFGMSS